MQREVGRDALLVRQVQERVLVRLSLNILLTPSVLLHQNGQLRNLLPVLLDVYVSKSEEQGDHGGEHDEDSNLAGEVPGSVLLLELGDRIISSEFR